ncbi:MAG TPA: hypothetical protein VFZ83_00090 [Acidimicrobiia bacterium]|nr:hypothetical protein [Acidimicrobiia bacterium]
MEHVTSSPIAAARLRARELVEQVDDAFEASATLCGEFGISDDAARQLVLSAQVRLFQDLAGVGA